MTTSETKETLVNVENVCGTDPKNFNRHKMWPFWDMSNVMAYATKEGILITDYNNMCNERHLYDIELCKIPSWIHHDEVDYIKNHKKLNEIAQELILLIHSEILPDDVQKRYDDLYAEAKNILSEIISKLDNKCLISSKFLEQDMHKYLEKNKKKYKTPLECLKLIEAFIHDLLAAKPFRWYGFYYIDGTIRPLTIDDIISTLYDI